MKGLFKINTYEHSLKQLITASLMSEAYPNYDHVENSIKVLYVPYKPNKRFYINDYIKRNELYDFVENNEEANELEIKIPNSLIPYVTKWFNENEKIFKRNFLTDLDFQAIIIFINGFGTRQIEGIAIPTTVVDKYLITLSFTIGQILDVKTTIANKSIKIPDVIDLFVKTLYETSSFDCSNIAEYLINKEKILLQRTLKNFEEKQRKSAYV